ncbi:MAG TPA: response regulator [Geopsychrobacteraceae bacterium]|nr:response regulator [Geopsychrobacteraceae bacterium]
MADSLNSKLEYRLLIVDDDRDFAASLSDLLESQNYLIATAFDVDTALTSLNRCGADIALIDIPLRQNDGLQLINQLKATAPDLVCVVMTALTDPDTAVSALKMGAYDYLKKPFTQIDLFATLNRCCERIVNVQSKRSMERARQESEERFRSLVDNIPGAVYRSSCDHDFTVRYCSPAIVEITGYPVEAFIDSGVRSYESIIHPDDAAARRTKLQTAVETLQPLSCEYRIVHADSSLRWVNERAQAVVSADDGAMHLDGVLLDITEQRRHGELIQHLTDSVLTDTGGDFFVNLLENLSIVLSVDYAFVGRIDQDDPGTVNSFIAFAHGEKIDNFSYQLAGTPCEKVLESRSVCSFPQDVQELFSESSLLVEMGVEAYVGTPLWRSDGVAVGMMVVFYSHTCEDSSLAENLLKIFADRASVELERLDFVEELKANERQYRKLSHEYQTVLEGIPDALVLFNSKMKIVWANRGAKALSSFDHEDLRGMECAVFWGCAEGRCDNCVRQVFEQNASFETVKRTVHGTVWGVKGFPVMGPDGSIVNVIQVASDLTEKVQLREQAAHSAHLAALGELAAGVAHEINNPTGLILLDMPVLKDSFCELLPLLDERARTEDDFLLAGLPYSRMRQEVPEIIDEVIDSAQRIKRIVEELKEFSNPSRGESALIDLNDVARKAVSLTRTPVNKATGNFQEHYEQNNLFCSGSPQRLEQVVVNLLLNACQALPDRNHGIEVRTFENKAKGIVGLAIHDEGIGISMENLTQITDPFFTTKRESGGSGLGLSVSSRIIDEHRGKLLFNSELGKGTVVTLELPQMEQEG